MTAFDTTNLRLAITVPAHGMVRFRLRCVVTGATTAPTVFLGVLNGATVVGRVQPAYENATANAATQNFLLDAEFTATGLTPGAMNVDAAYGVEVVVAATNIKYGGPNNTTGADAWGAFCFEAWDPQPIATAGQLSVDANGRVDVIKIAGTTQTTRDIGASVLLSAGTGAGQLDFTSGVVKANATQVDGAALTAHASGKLPADLLTVAGTAQTARDLGGQLDATVSSRLASASYTAPDNADIVSILGFVDTEIAAIKAKTDQLTFTVANKLNVNILAVNGITVTGAGTAGSPWGP